MTKAKQQTKTGEGDRGDKRSLMSNSPVSVAKPTKKKTEQKGDKTRKKRVKTEQKGKKKLGRNLDGTFKAGHKESIGNNGGRPVECLSFRQQAKLRAAEDPRRVTKAIETLEKIASDPNHPKCVEAIDKLIKLNGNYDPAETKDVTPAAPERPLKGLSLAEVREALAMKRRKKK